MTSYAYTDSFAPDSTLVEKAFYHRGERNLFVKFTGSNLYGYSKVPFNVWESFAQASSVGNYYNTNVKGKYDVIYDIGLLHFIGGIKEDKIADTHKFVIVGVSPVQYELEAATIEDAKADFARIFPEGVLKEVRVSFE